MIKQLEIENFRCFGQSTLSGFERVNLIGGQNNSGKTAFLEALYLNCSPRAETVMKLRGISKETILTFPERAWSGLFLDHDNRRAIKVRYFDQDDIYPELHLLQFSSYSETQNYIRSRIEKLEKSLKHNNSRRQVLVIRPIKQTLTDEELESLNYLELVTKFDIKEINSLQSFERELSNYSEVLHSALYIAFYQNERYIGSSHILISPNIKLVGRKKTIERNSDSQVNAIISSTNKELEDYPLLPSSFISASERASNSYLAEQYDKCYLQGYSDKVKEAFHIIDPSITEIRTLTSGEPMIYLSRKNQRPMSITLFGDAMNRVAHFALELINNQAGILLVDEIENGIHHSHQKQLWQWLFALAVELDVQIFATTHSLEMLTAFKEAAMGTQYESEVAYFEFVRHVKTGEIIGIKHKVDELDYALSHDGEIRGE